jgi:hypothetical protein
VKNSISIEDFYKMFFETIFSQQNNDWEELKKQGYTLDDIVVIQPVAPNELADLSKYRYVILDKHTGEVLFNRAFQIK